MVFWIAPTTGLADDNKAYLAQTVRAVLRETTNSTAKISIINDERDEMCP